LRAGFGIAMLSFLFYGAGLFSYYCAEPDSIVVHPGPFSTPVIYRWADVQRISTSCTFGRGGMSTHFTLGMKDSRVIGLGGDSWPMLKRNFSSVAASLKPVPYLYDNTQTDRCPAQLRQLFAKRPS
jgi:hypothetical protein